MDSPNQNVFQRNARWASNLFAAAFMFGGLLAASRVEAATVTVDVIDDLAPGFTSGCTLRHAVASVNLGVPFALCAGTTTGVFGVNDLIVLPAQQPQIPFPYRVDQGEITISKDVVISGTSSSYPSMITASDQSRIFFVEKGVQAVFDRLYLMHGRAKIGGAILAEGNVRFESCVIADSHASYVPGGGGIMSSGSVLMEQTAMFGNTAGRPDGIGSNGGAIYSTGPLTILNSSIQTNAAYKGNSATNVGLGGGIFSSGQMTIQDTEISNNDAERGGGIYQDGRASTIWRSHIDDNWALENGGGIAFRGDDGSASLSLDRTTVNSNAAKNGGGISSFGAPRTPETPRAHFSLTQSSITRNVTGHAKDDHSPAGQAGAIHNEGVHVWLTNSTLGENSSHTGASNIYNGAGGTLSIASSTLRPLDNKFQYIAAGPMIFNATDGGNVRIRGSILAGAEDHLACDGYNYTASFGSNVISYGGNCASTIWLAPTDLVVDDVMVEPLVSNAAGTEHYPLDPDSPAIDHIPAAACVSLVSTPVDVDQRGFTRLTAANTQCDAGSIELDGAEHN